MAVCHLCVKNFHSWWKLDKIVTKIILHSFFETRCRPVRQTHEDLLSFSAILGVSSKKY